MEGLCYIIYSISQKSVDEAKQADDSDEINNRYGYCVRIWLNTLVYYLIKLTRGELE